jgi:hypothetical protein
MSYKSTGSQIEITQLQAMLGDQSKLKVNGKSMSRLKITMFRNAKSVQTDNSVKSIAKKQRSSLRKKIIKEKTSQKRKSKAAKPIMISFLDGAQIQSTFFCINTNRIPERPRV